MKKSKRPSFIKKKGFALVTMMLFLISITLHWTFGWRAYKQEQEEHGLKPEWSNFTDEALRDTFENWQSEFLQLIWQVAGLAMLWHVGSPQSKEEDERKEAKIDFIMRSLQPEKAEQVIRELEEKFPKE
jgi:hypothetical protein